VRRCCRVTLPALGGPRQGLMTRWFQQVGPHSQGGGVAGRSGCEELCGVHGIASIGGPKAGSDDKVVPAGGSTQPRGGGRQGVQGVKNCVVCMALPALGGPRQGLMTRSQQVGVGTEC
jgi:hypothetical protein